MRFESIGTTDITRASILTIICVKFARVTFVKARAENYVKLFSPNRVIWVEESFYSKRGDQVDSLGRPRFRPQSGSEGLSKPLKKCTVVAGTGPCNLFLSSRLASRVSREAACGWID